MPETLREKATKKMQGPDANPSQLGDPISIKAETSDNVPTEDAEGAKPSSSSKPESSGGDGDKGDSLRKKAVKKLNGPDANPSQLGDPISLKNETSPGVPVESEQGTERERVVERGSKL
ncbi:hypothetical protein HD806DRAFT_51128 [Xylariaceae sp. AK1471]|nr:hypothetical protein HD806DRAFT_51128 [Xylariaceae sp. AK1471]